MSELYDDIINLPHHISDKHPQMSRSNRAAQFSSFAALTGFESAIKEAERRTDERIELGESDIELLHLKLNLIAEKISDRPEVTVTYFVPDEKKKGGAYVTADGAVKRVDDYENTIVFVDGRKIAITDVFDIDGELFRFLT